MTMVYHPVVVRLQNEETPNLVFCLDRSLGHARIAVENVLCPSLSEAVVVHGTVHSCTKGYMCQYHRRHRRLRVVEDVGRLDTTLAFDHHDKGVEDLQILPVGTVRHRVAAAVASFHCMATAVSSTHRQVVLVEACGRRCTVVLDVA